jgi:PAS domain-containing protein
MRPLGSEDPDFAALETESAALQSLSGEPWCAWALLQPSALTCRIRAITVPSAQWLWGASPGLVYRRPFMHIDAPIAEAFLHSAAAAARQGRNELHRALEEIPLPVYVTDADGVITYYNRACVPFAGRTPAAGRDTWCVTWKLYTNTGQSLPHEACPMAVAIRERRSVRGIEAVAERPDGTRVSFLPYPTPLFDHDGNLIGAVNLFIDLTDLKHAQSLRAQAARCRRLAGASTDMKVAITLEAMAAEYEEQADRITRAH